MSRTRYRWPVTPRRTPDGGWLCEAGTATVRPCNQRAVWCLASSQPHLPGSVVCDDHHNARWDYFRLDGLTEANP